MSEFRAGEVAGGRLDAGPFDAEPVGIQPGVGQQSHIFLVPVVAVIGVSGSLEREPWVIVA